MDVDSIVNHILNVSIQNELKNTLEVSITGNDVSKSVIDQSIQNIKDKHNTTIRTVYQNYENNIDRINNFLSRKIVEYPLAQLYGGLNYAMDITQVKTHLFVLFKQIFDRGDLISGEDFDLNYNKDIWYYRKQNDLTKVWGNLYLESMFSSNNNLNMFAVPRFKIVVDDINSFSVSIFKMNPICPIITNIDGGHIVYENIAGNDVTSKAINNRLSHVGIMNNSKKVNIIQRISLYEGNNNKYYVMDTKMKHFEIDLKTFKYKQMQKLLFYLRERFDYVTRDENNYKGLYYDVSIKNISQEAP